MPYVHGKTPGKKKPLFDDFAIPISKDHGKSVTLRELIAQIVRENVEAFQDRQQQRQFLRVLTERQISEGLEKGKVESGLSDVPVRNVDVDDAIETALQAFEDGLYFVVIDEESVRLLDAPLDLHADSHITFLRLTLLSGG